MSHVPPFAYIMAYIHSYYLKIEFLITLGLNISENVNLLIKSAKKNPRQRLVNESRVSLLSCVLL